jgi:single-stranded DNA-binding protein
MSRAVVAGSLHKPVEVRTSKNGNPFATFTVVESVNGSRRFWRAVAFDEGAIAALKDLPAGEPIAIGGEIDCEIWTPEDGREPRLNWKVTADAVLTAQRKRKPKADRAMDNSSPRGGAAVMNDDIPFAAEWR